MAYCKICGSTVDELDRVCANCGAPVNASAPGPSASAEAATHVKNAFAPQTDLVVGSWRFVGSILLLGNNRGKEAPHRTCTGNLCPDCQGAVDKGAVLLIEVRDGEGGKQNPWRTGFMIGVRREAIEESAIAHS